MLPIWVTAVVVSGALAVLASETGRPALVALFKPLATFLLLGVVGWPTTDFARLVALGIVLSVVGDVALLWPGNRAFIVGLAAFLLAHVAYVAAFWRVAVWTPHVAVVAAVTAVTTVILLRAIWRGADGMHGPTIAYGAVISAMVVSAAATVGGRLPGAPFAAAGASLFYLSDASLALNRFRRPIPHAAMLTLGIYWIGQIGIALAARGA